MCARIENSHFFLFVSDAHYRFCMFVPYIKTILLNQIPKCLSLSVIIYKILEFIILFFVFNLQTQLWLGRSTLCIQYSPRLDWKLTHDHLKKLFFFNMLPFENKKIIFRDLSCSQRCWFRLTIVGYYALQISKQVPMFRKSLLTPSSGFSEDGSISLLRNVSKTTRCQMPLSKLSN